MSYLSPLSLELADILPVTRQPKADPATELRQAVDITPASHPAPAAGWTPNELGLARATLLASAFVLAFSTLFVSVHGDTWLQAAWLRPDAASWSGPEITTASLLPQSGTTPMKTAMLTQR